MARFSYLSRHGSRRYLAFAALAVLAGLVTYTGSVWVGIASRDLAGWDAARSQVAHDVLVLLTGLFIGGGGIVAGVVESRRARLVNHTGVLLLSLTKNIKTLADTLAATAWSLGEPMQRNDRIDKLSGHDAAELLYSEDGHRVLTAAILVSFDDILNAGPDDEASPSGASFAAIIEKARNDDEPIARFAGDLHQRALELAEYEPTGADELLAATGDLRAACDDFRHQTRFGPQNPQALATVAATLFMTLMQSLVAVISAARQAEDATAIVLEGSKAGRQILDPYREEWKHAEEFRKDSLDIAELSRSLQQDMDALNQGLAEIQAEIDGLRSP